MKKILLTLAARGLSLALFIGTYGYAAEPGAPQPLGSLDIWTALEASRRPLIIADETLQGTGGTWLIERARMARFTLIGETHYNVETPHLTLGLLKELRDAGYGSYVVESGPETTRLLMSAVEKGGLAAGEALLTRFPSSIAFLDRREELATAVRALALGYDVRGIDQEQMSSPRLLLHRLAELARDEASERLVHRILDRWEHADRSGNQSGGLLIGASVADFDSLAAAFYTNDEAARIVRQLRTSSWIYGAFTERRYYDSNALRVDLIKRNFLAHLQQAGDSPLSDRRALIKTGSVHSGRGRSPMHVYDIGNLAAELAYAGGGTSFHILVLAAGALQADGTVTSWRTESPHLAPFYDLAAANHPVVFDLEPLRPLLTRGRLPSELGDFDIALRYDAIVLFPHFRPSQAITAKSPGPGFEEK